MRLVGIGLLLAAFATGCAMQSGSEGDADWTRPQEVTANPNGGSASSALVPSSARGAVLSPSDNGGSPPPSNSPLQHPDPAPWVAPGTTPGGASASDQTGDTNGHPDPAPWHGTDTTAGTTDTGGGSSTSAPSDEQEQQNGHRRLPLAFAP